MLPWVSLVSWLGILTLFLCGEFSLLRASVFFVVQIMPDNLDYVMLAKLQPRAQEMVRGNPYYGSRTFRDALRRCTPAMQRRYRREQEQKAINDLWTEAYRQGLTRCPIPPLFVSIFCRVLWSVVWHLAQQVIAEWNKPSAT